MRFAFIRVEKAHYPVTVLCRVLQVSRSGFYRWLQWTPSRRERADGVLRRHVRIAFTANRRAYGSPRIFRVLRQQQIPCSQRRIERVMRQAGITPDPPRRFKVTTHSAHPYLPAENVLNRDFTSPAPNRRWAADITYVWTREGWLYLAVVLDLYARRIVGWAMHRRLTAPLVLTALDMALRGRRPAPGLLHHSDRGSQYAAGEYQLRLARHGIVCSMSRKGDCWDNAVVESFFATLKRELIHRRRFLTRQQANQAIFEYIEVFYNRQRLHSALGYVSPMNFEQRMVQAVA